MLYTEIPFEYDALNYLLKDLLGIGTYNLVSMIAPACILQVQILILLLIINYSSITASKISMTPLEQAVATF